MAGGRAAVVGKEVRVSRSMACWRASREATSTALREGSVTTVSIAIFGVGGVVSLCLFVEVGSTER